MWYIHVHACAVHGYMVLWQLNQLSANVITLSVHNHKAETNDDDVMIATAYQNISGVPAG